MDQLYTGRLYSVVAIIFMFLEWDAETHKLLRYTKTVCLKTKQKDNKLFYSTFIYDSFRFSLAFLNAFLHAFLGAIGRICVCNFLYKLQIMFKHSIIYKRYIFMHSVSGSRYPSRYDQLKNLNPCYGMSMKY